MQPQSPPESMQPQQFRQLPPAQPVIQNVRSFNEVLQASLPPGENLFHYIQMAEQAGFTQQQIYEWIGTGQPLPQIEQLNTIPSNTYQNPPPVQPSQARIPAERVSARDSSTVLPAQPRTQTSMFAQLNSPQIPMANSTSNTSLAGLTTLIGTFNTAGISPLVPSVAVLPTQPTTTTAANVNQGISPGNPELPDTKFALHERLRLKPPNPLRNIQQINIVAKDHRAPKGPSVTIPISELRASRIQEIRDREALGPDPSIPGIVRAVIAQSPLGGTGPRKHMPSPHVPFDHELWRLIEEQLSLGNYSAQQVTEWYAENERWAHLQADPSSQSPFRRPMPPPSPMDEVLPIIPASTFDLARISQD